MAVSLDRVAERLKGGNSVGVDKNGSVMDSNPKNDGTSESNAGFTTSEPKRHYVD